MMKSYAKIALYIILATVLTLGSGADPLQEQSFTLDERPVKRVEPVDPHTFIDVPKPLRKLFPVLQKIENKISLGQESGDVQSLLDAVRDLTQAELFTGARGATGDSDRLLREATELAYQQRDPEALRESLVLWSSPSRAGDNQDRVRQTSERLEQVEKENAAMSSKKRCRIIFHNRTDRPVQVTVNRKPMGSLAPGERHEVGELLAGRQYLGATDESLQWGPRRVYVGPGEIFNWRLFD